MATNGNNSGNVNYSSPGQSNMGITGNLQNIMAGKEYSERFYREKSGYLDNSITEVKNLLKYYEEISAITKDLSKTEQNRFKKQQDALKEQLKTLEYVKDTREIDFEDSVKLIKESNKLLISGSKEYQRVMEETQESQSKADKEHLGNLKEASATVNEIRENAEKTNQDMKDTAKTLNNTSANFGKSLSNTLKSAGDFVANLSNMLSLSSLANNAAEQNLRSKLNIQNSVRKQLGLSTDTQYNQFKDSIMSELQNMNSSMGNLFSADDAYAYFENLEKLGITDRKMAEEQMRAAVIGNKYLGVSVETQSALLKFMKLTDNSTALSNHNKTIVGLLKSDLGVSREQLDALTQMAASDQDSLMASGMSADTYAKYLDQYTTIGAVLSSKYGEATSKAMMGAISELARSSYNDAEKLIANYGPDAVGSMQYLKNSGDVMGTIQRLMNSTSGWGIVSGDNVANSTLQSELGMTSQAAVLGFNKLSKDWTEVSGTTNDILSGLKSISDLDVENYIQENTELTFLEKLENSTSFIKDKIETWSTTFSLANIALGLYIASGFTKMVGGLNTFIGGWKTGGGLKGGLQALLGGASGSGTALSAGMAKFMAGGVAVGLTAAAIAGIAKATSDAVPTVNDISEDRINNTKQRLKSENNALAGNEAYVKATSIADIASQKGGFSGFAGTLANVTSGYMNNFNKGNAEKHNEEVWKNFVRGQGGIITDSDDWRALQYMYAIALHQVGTPSVAQKLFGLDKAAIKAYLNTEPDADQKIYNALNRYNRLFIDNWGSKYPVDFNKRDWDQNLQLEGYHKAGKYYIPKDNYRALLHKGEMVLNEKEANAYREMEKNVGGQSDTLYSNQQKIVLGKIVPSKTDVGYAGAQMGLPSGWSLTSGYGTYTNMRDKYGKVAKHRGLDFAAPTGTQIRAANSGKIYSASYSGTGFGNSIKIATDSGVYNRYGHMTRFALGIRNGMKVRRGQLIGYVGSTGNSTGPHLHFQVDKSANDRDDINPWPYVMMEMFGGKGALGVSDVSVSGSNSATSATSTLPKVTTARFINGASAITSTGGGESNVGGADRVVNSVDGGFNRLIAYLDNISKRQDEQQILLEAFSKSRASGKDL